ncbi:MAG: hypothetical protein JWN51_3223, partial [Phycisphaerales bacterium]|nr:hypothetical protein [Phycisphaerales bacterium]
MDADILHESLKRSGQENVLRFWGELSPQSRQKLQEQLQGQDLTVLRDLAQQ